jgi:predicted RNase H-like nuclease (RuvC/YqgF family)
MQESIAALRQQVQQQQQQQPCVKKPPPPCRVQSTSQDASTAADTAHTALASAKDQPDAAAPADAKAHVTAAAAAEVAALRDMEAQLMRLSATVKSYQGEREQLRQVLMAGCAERQALQQQVQELTAQLQEKQGGCKQEVQAAQQGQLSRAYWESLS